MNRFKLYRLLRKNTTLSYKRSPVFEQNKWAKGLTYFGAGLLALYMIMYGCLIAMTAEGEAGRMISLMPIILAIDFLFRFVIQTTPGMMVKPYILLPISRYSAIECFLLSSHLSGYNFLWLCMFVPYSIILIFAGAGFWPIVLELICCVLLIILNSQVYLFFRTLINRKVVWFLAAVAVYSIPFLPWILRLDRKGFERMIDMYATSIENMTMRAMLMMQRERMVLFRRFDFSSIFRYSPTMPKRLRKLNCDTFFRSFSFFFEISSYTYLNWKWRFTMKRAAIAASTAGSSHQSVPTLCRASSVRAKVLPLGLSSRGE